MIAGSAASSQIHQATESCDFKTLQARRFCTHAPTQMAVYWRFSESAEASPGMPTVLPTAGPWAFSRVTRRWVWGWAQLQVAVGLCWQILPGKRWLTFGPMKTE